MLIVIEGIDGSGKSTLAQGLTNALNQNNIPILLTKEPGGSKLGKKLREIVQHQPVPITPVAEFLLFAADRAQHFQEVIIPALQENKIVISDRMGDSSVVYQGYGRGIDIDMINKVNEWAMQGIKPNLIFYLKISPEIAMERLKQRKKLSAFEQEQETFTKKLIHGFDEHFRNKKNVITLDGNQSPEQVTNQAVKAIESWRNHNQ